MKVYKFGGGILKNGSDIKILAKILEKENNNKIVVVVSAFNKITSKFEWLLNNYFSENRFDKNVFNEIISYHNNLISSIFENEILSTLQTEINLVYAQVNNIFEQGLSENYQFEYDRIISFGEILSSKIINKYLIFKGLKSKLADSRKLIITNSIYTEAKVDWELTENAIKDKCVFEEGNICLVQGFIASDKKGNATTLGREGSDFTASVFAYLLDAESVTFWKEVEGIYNSDPAITEGYELLPKLSYKEAVEQAYYGAKILHPKTIKPLQNKKIPIVVRSFYKEELKGTSIIDISGLSPDLYPNIPIYIIKEKQILISVSTKDFSFISEDNLGEIFSLLSKYRIKVNLMQSSAINFSVCVSNNKFKVPNFINDLKSSYNILYNSNLELITIRHYNDFAIKKMTNKKKVLVEQKSRHTVRFVIQ